MTTTHTGPEPIKRCKDCKKAAQQKHTLSPANPIMEVARHSGTDTKRVLCNGTAWQHMCTLASSHRENKVLQTSLVQLSSQQRWTQRIRSTSMLCLTACHTPKIHLLLLTHLDTLQNVKGVLVLVLVKSALFRYPICTSLGFFEFSSSVWHHSKPLVEKA